MQFGSPGSERNRKPSRALGGQLPCSLDHIALPLRSQEKPLHHRYFALILLSKYCIEISFISVTEFFGAPLNSGSVSLPSPWSLQRLTVLTH